MSRGNFTRVGAVFHKATRTIDSIRINTAFLLVMAKITSLESLSALVVWKVHLLSESLIRHD